MSVKITPATSLRKSKYNLRTKFVKALQKAELEGDVFDEAFRIALDMSAEKLFNVLWAMSFESSQPWALSELGLSTSKITTNRTYIPRDLVPSFKAALRTEYKKSHPNFLTVPVKDSTYVLAYKDFVAMAGTDPVLSYGIFIRVRDTLLYSEDSLVYKTIYLLRSIATNKIHGGLKNIGLTNAEATKFYDCGCAIAELIENMLATKKEMEEKMKSGEHFSYRPFAGLKEMLPDLPVSQSTEVTTEESAEEDVAPELVSEPVMQKAITSGEVLNNKELFKRVIDIADQLASLGLSPKAVLDNLDLVAEFSSVTNNLSSSGFSPDNVLEKKGAIMHLIDADAEL